jgi:hypothetical protein
MARATVARDEALRSQAQLNLSGQRSLADLYWHYGIDANSIVAAAESITPERPIRYAPFIRSA